MTHSFISIEDTLPYELTEQSLKCMKKLCITLFFSYAVAVNKMMVDHCLLVTTL